MKRSNSWLFQKTLTELGNNWNLREKVKVLALKEEQQKE